MKDFLFSTEFIVGMILFFVVVAAIAKFFNLDSYIKDEENPHKKHQKIS